MVIRMLEVRRGFQGSFSAKLGVDEFDPEQIAPTIQHNIQHKFSSSLGIGKHNVYLHHSDVPSGGRSW